MAVLEAHELAKVYREGAEHVHALQGVSLELAAGEVVALEGPSGSGKSTLLSILGCILTATAGELRIGETTVYPGPASRLAAIRKRSIGFVFQQYNLFGSLSAWENVEYALNIKDQRGAAARREAERVLDLVGLADRKGFLPRDLSGGQKQRVAIARALAGRPPILLADEPTANLDTQVGAQVLSLFQTLARREGSALLIVTHDPRVRTVADRVLVIRDGCLTNGGVS
ncbi:MAG: ABC transporter ATP-binding protein [Acidobacteria bacterium]|nr:MAG: ABC transporter ATP-binding protein [Acidobacteriota bacterium]